MHCRYGCITEDIQSKGLVGKLLRKAMDEYDQIWVLDSRKRWIFMYGVLFESYYRLNSNLFKSKIQIS